MRIFYVIILNNLFYLCKIITIITILIIDNMIYETICGNNFKQL